MKLIYSRETDEDIAKIHAYITNDIGDAQAAYRTTSQILHQAELLQDFPQLGKSIEDADGDATDFRMLVTGRYLILYRYDDQCVTVLRIVNALLDYTRLI